MANPKERIWQFLEVVDPSDTSRGYIPMADNDPMRATYSTFIAGYTPVATPGDIIEIKGSATKLVRIRRILVTGTATAAANISVGLIRRSAANTQTFNTAVALIPRDGSHDAATSTVRTASANPSVVGATALGAGFIDGGRLNIAPAANGGIDRLVFEHSWLNDKAMILNGATDCLYLSLAANTTNLTGPAWPSGGALDITIVLTEE